MKIIISGNARIEYEQSTNVKKIVDKKVLLLKQDAEYGIHISKNKIPKYYINQGANNLWKMNLPKGWRLLYTIHTTDETILIIVDILDHKSYTKRFGYKK